MYFHKSKNSINSYKTIQICFQKYIILRLEDHVKNLRNHYRGCISQLQFNGRSTLLKHAEENIGVSIGCSEEVCLFNVIKSIPCLQFNFILYLRK